MQAVFAIPIAGSAFVTSAERVNRSRSVQERHPEHDAPAAEDAGPGGVVYSFSAHAAAARARHEAGEQDDLGLDSDRPARRQAFTGRGPGTHRSVLSPSADALPVRLSEFREGSALEAQLVTPSLHRVHAKVMARRAE